MANIRNDDKTWLSIAGKKTQRTAGCEYKLRQEFPNSACLILFTCAAQYYEYRSGCEVCYCFRKLLGVAVKQATFTLKVYVLF